MTAPLAIAILRRIEITVMEEISHAVTIIIAVDHLMEETTELLMTGTTTEMIADMTIDLHLRNMMLPMYHLTIVEVQVVIETTAPMIILLVQTIAKEEILEMITIKMMTILVETIATTVVLLHP